MTEHACKHCGYHEHAPGCYALSEGERIVGQINLVAYRVMNTLNLQVTHCWLPRSQFSALKTWARELGAWRTDDLPDLTPNVVHVCTWVGMVEVVPHDADVTAWAFREPSEDDR
jgi:hypothetical protein